MARMPDLEPFCEKHGLQILTIADLIDVPPARTEKLVERVVTVDAADGVRRLRRDRVSRDDSTSRNTWPW